MNGGMILVLVLLIAVIADTQFINYENEIEKKCSGETVYFNWTYSTSVAIFIVEWKVNGSRIASDSGSFSPVTSYIGRVFQISNGQISLGPLTIADSGTYKAEVSYVDGTGHDSNQTNLIVYDVLSKETEIEESSGILRPSFYDSSITYTWTSPNNVTSTGQYLTVSISGNYTLCVSEGKAGCLNSTLDPCTTKYVKKVNGCKYSDAELFLGGFSCFLIVFGITSIIMLIFLLCQMLPKIFEDKKTNKIIIIVVFNSFALIFGFALGFGLKECDKRDLGLGLGLGFGFILAIALVLTLYIYHKQCGSKKENEDENRFSLDSCFRKCQVKPEKEIESPPKFNSKKPEDSPKRVGLKS